MTLEISCPTSEAATALRQHLIEQAGDRYSHILGQLMKEIEEHNMSFSEFAEEYLSAWGMVEIQTN